MILFWLLFSLNVGALLLNLGLFSSIKSKARWISLVGLAIATASLVHMGVQYHHVTHTVVPDWVLAT